MFFKNIKVKKLKERLSYCSRLKESNITKATYNESPELYPRLGNMAIPEINGTIDEI